MKKNGDKNPDRFKTPAFTLEVIFTLLTIVLGYYFFLNSGDSLMVRSRTEYLIVVGIPACDGFRRIFRSIKLKNGSGKFFIWYLFFGLMMLAVAVLMLYTGNVSVSRKIGLLYFVPVIADRVISCIRKPKVVRIIFNALFCFVIVFLSESLSVQNDFSEDLMLVWVVIYSLLLSMILALAFVFGRIKLGMLKDIIRKTYAAEVVSGLVLLVLVFSFIMMLIEPQMNTYGDALWYCFAIITTIGFGDISAVTLIGRVLSVILGVYGIIVVALITSIIVAYYNEMKNSIQDKEAKEEKEAGGKEREDKEETGTTGRSENTENDDRSGSTENTGKSE